MELDKALQFAMTLAWDDLAKVAELSSARIEYQRDSDTPLEHLSVWSTRGRGYQDLVCDYWTAASSAHASGANFRNGHSSDKLAHTLDLIMHNQDHFTHPAHEGREGLVLIYAPAENERTEAAAGISGITGGGR